MLSPSVLIFSRDILWVNANLAEDEGEGFFIFFPFLSLCAVTTGAATRCSLLRCARYQSEWIKKNYC